jgi:Ca2+-binding RTX toxin-like protein
MAGLGGNDTYIVDNAGDAVIEGAGGGGDTIFTSVSYSLAAGTEVETLSSQSHTGTTALALVGNNFNQTLYGNAGDNLLNGLGGIDIMFGLAGNDTYVVDNAQDQVNEGFGGGDDTVFTDISYSLGSNQYIETLSTQTHNATNALNLVGNQLNNYLYGNFGNNLLNGVDGADTMIGLYGDDTYSIDNAGDLVVELEGQGNDVVFTFVSHTLTNGNEIETLSTVVHTATTAIDLGGNDYANHLVGNYGNNYLNGGGGADLLTGLNGNDTYVIDNAGDLVEEQAGFGSDAVLSFVSYTLAANQEVETLSTTFHAGTGAIDLTGNNLAQTIIGNNGANVLNGGAGNDTLLGNGGADIFAFTTALGASNVDAIADFAVVDDTIRLDDAVFTALGLGTLGANAFVTGTQAGDADDRIIYNSATGALYYDADGSGAGAMVQFATLSTGLAMTAADFVVV